jgi:hypothetical protein
MPLGSKNFIRTFLDMVQLFNKTIVTCKQTTFVAKDMACENSQNLENTYRPEFFALPSKGNGSYNALILHLIRSRPVGLK